jgi:hypothetical protein
MDTPEHKFVPFQSKLMEITVLIGVLIKVSSAIRLKTTVELDLHVNLQTILPDKIWAITDVIKIGNLKFASVAYQETDDNILIF